MYINIKQFLGMTALLTTMSSSPANARQSLPASTPNLSVMQAGNYKGKIRKVYKSIQDGDILKAKTYMKEIPSKDYQDLFPVYELAGYYLNTFDGMQEYAYHTCYHNLIRILSDEGQRTRTDAFLFDFGLSTGKIRDKIEHSMLDEAKDNNTLEAMDRFIRMIQNDGLKQQAESIRHEIAYQELCQSLNLYNCERFLERYPTGKHSDEVRDERDRLAYEGIGDNIKQLENYIKKYPSSKYVPDAKARIEQFNLPVFTASQAKQVAEAQLAGKKILGAFPFSNTERGNDQIIAVAECMGNKELSIDSNIFLVLVHYKGIDAVNYKTFATDANPILRSHTIDLVDKQRIGNATYIILCYRNFSYGTECRDCVERVYAIYNPDNMAFHKVIYSGKDFFAPDGTLDRIEGEWLPSDINTYTKWLKEYAERQLKPYIKKRL